MLMQVHIPTPLRSYTNAPQVEASGETIADMFANLEQRYPGIRFRVINEQNKIREHIRIFVNQTIADNLNAPLAPTDQVRIVMAISGG
jgi:sulfur-carrier protein